MVGLNYIWQEGVAVLDEDAQPIDWTDFGRVFKSAQCAGYRTHSGVHGRICSGRYAGQGILIFPDTAANDADTARRRPHSVRPDREIAR